MTLGIDAHPVLACVRSLQAALSNIVDLDPIFMPTSERASALIALTEVLATTAALQARMLASADDLAADIGARDAAGWLAAAVHSDYPTVRRSLELGRALEHTPLLASAMTAGRIDAEKARIVVRALEALPDSTTEALRSEAEAALVPMRRPCPHRRWPSWPATLTPSLIPTALKRPKDAVCSATNATQKARRS